MDNTQRALLVTVYSAISNEWQGLLEEPTTPNVLLSRVRGRLDGPEFRSSEPVLECWRINWLSAFARALNGRAGLEVYADPLACEIPDDLSSLTGS